MGKVICITNNKGGVAKTTTVAALGSILSAAGKSVLLIDMDPQSNLIDRFSNSETEIDVSKILLEEQGLKVHMLKTNLAILPTSKDSYKLDYKYKNKFEFRRSEEALKKLIESLRDKLDYIIIDTPPAVGGFHVINSLVASDYVLMVTDPSGDGYKGTRMVSQLVSEIQEVFNPSLKVIGVLVTRFDGRANIHRDWYEQIKENYGDLLFDVAIRKNTDMEVINSTGADITTFELDKLEGKKVKIFQTVNCVQDYKNLVEELENRITNGKK